MTVKYGVSSRPETQIRISGKFRVSGSVDLVSGSGVVVSGYPDFGYLFQYSITRGYLDPDP